MIVFGIILLQVAVPLEVWKWLLLQTPVVVFLAVVLYLQWKRMGEMRKEHKAEMQVKDDRINSLSDKALTVASLYDVKSDLNSKEHDGILENQKKDHEILIEIKNKL